jgi:hypothetical protein
LASVAIEEKLALLKIALCRAPILTIESSAVGRARPVLASEMGIGCPNS